MRQRWPSKLWVVRHGQSAGNVARDAADAAGLAAIDIDMRDVDVPLSELGHRQADALGRWFAAMPEGRAAGGGAGFPLCPRAADGQGDLQGGRLRRRRQGAPQDERLREREFGLWDRLTTAGVREKFPEQAEQRTLLGKFYHRPPGGESWADVILRLRSALDTVSLHHADRRVLIVCHQVVVLCFRYILEEMDEAEILGIDREPTSSIAASCEYEFEPDDEKDCVPKLVCYNFAAPLIEEDAPITSEPDAMVAAR
jgi:broad specificity phosphatase PhoE